MSSRTKLSTVLLAAACLASPTLAQAADAPAAANVVQAAGNAAGGSKGASSASTITKAVARDVTAAVQTVPGAPAAKPLGRVELSRVGTATLEVAAVTMTMPAQGAPSVVGRTAVYQPTAATPSTRIAAQSVEGGMRALINISDASAPERYPFVFGGQVAKLELKPNGSVDTLDVNGGVIGTVQTPWALDASGTPVPTHFEIDGTTLTQVVQHRGGNYAYGITADPAWFAVVAVRACLALRCYRWMSNFMLRQWHANPYGPVVIGWIKAEICPRTRLC